jgi:hypothetical protein
VDLDVGTGIRRSSVMYKPIGRWVKCTCGSTVEDYSKNVEVTQQE